MQENAKWQDWASFVLGLWLAMSPWLLGHSHDPASTANAAVVGLALALGSHFEASCCFSVEWLHALAGGWLVAAPFVFGYGPSPIATANSITVGVMVLVLAVSASPLDKEIGRLLHSRASDQ